MKYKILIATLLIVFSTKPYSVYSQSIDSCLIQQINIALAQGIYAQKMLIAKKAELVIADSIIRTQDSIIANQNKISTHNEGALNQVIKENKALTNSITKEKQKKRYWRTATIANSSIIALYIALKLKLL